MLLKIFKLFVFHLLLRHILGSVHYCGIYRIGQKDFI